jgi:hypothetical protein
MKKRKANCAFRFPHTPITASYLPRLLQRANYLTGARSQRVFHNWFSRIPQGLKPVSQLRLFGTAEVVP